VRRIETVFSANRIPSGVLGHVAVIVVPCGENILRVTNDPETENIYLMSEPVAKKSSSKLPGLILFHKQMFEQVLFTQPANLTSFRGIYAVILTKTIIRNLKSVEN